MIYLSFDQWPPWLGGVGVGGRSTESLYHLHIWIYDSLIRGRLDARINSTEYPTSTKMCCRSPWRIALIRRPSCRTDLCTWPCSAAIILLTRC